MAHTRWHTRASIRRRGSQGFISLGLVAVLASGALVAALGTGVSRSVVKLAEGGTWLWGEGRIVHVNGAAGVADGTVELGDMEGRLQVVSRRDGVFVLSPQSGRLVKVSPGTLEKSAPQEVRGSRGQQLVSGRDGLVWIVDAKRGKVKRVDPATGRLIGRAARLLAPLGQAAADDSGTLWLPLRSKGTVVGLRGTDRVADVPVGSGQLDCVLVDGRPVVVDTAMGWVQPVRTSGAEPSRIDLGLEGPLLMPERAEGRLLPIWAPGAGRLVIVDVLRGSVVPAKTPVADATLSTPPVVVGDLVFIADPGSGRLISYDAHSGTERESQPFTAPGKRVELSEAGGLLYVNEPSGTSAAVWDPVTSEFRTIDKTDIDQPTPPTDPKPPVLSPLPTPSPVPGNVGGAVGASGGVPASPVPPNAAPPDPPIALRAEPGNGAVILGWATPANNGSPITGYQVVCDGPETHRREVGPVAAWTMAGLNNGSRYRCSVAAVNAAGRSKAASFEPITPDSGAPEPPAKPIAEPGDGEITLTFVPLTAAERHGANVRGYVAECNNGARAEGGADSRSIDVRGLRNGVPVSCSIAPAGNEAIKSSPSDAVVPFGKPVVRNARASLSGDRTITVAFDVDANGRASTCVAFVGGAPYGGGCGQIVVGGLAYGTDFRVRVDATNPAGATTADAGSVRTNDQPPPPPPPPPKPPRTVAISKGGSAIGQPLTSGNGNCSHASCAWVNVTIRNFAPDATLTVQCNSSLDAVWKTYSVITDSGGNADAVNRGCFYGYPGFTVQFIVDGVGSNAIVW